MPLPLEPGRYILNNPGLDSYAKFAAYVLDDLSAYVFFRPSATSPWKVYRSLTQEQAPKWWAANAGTAGEVWKKDVISPEVWKSAVGNIVVKHPEADAWTLYQSKASAQNELHKGSEGSPATDGSVQAYKTNGMWSMVLSPGELPTAYTTSKGHVVVPLPGEKVLQKANVADSMYAIQHTDGTISTHDSKTGAVKSPSVDEGAAALWQKLPPVAVGKVPLPSEVPAGMSPVLYTTVKAQWDSMADWEKDLIAGGDFQKYLATKPDPSPEVIKQVNLFDADCFNQLQTSLVASSPSATYALIGSAKNYFEGMWSSKSKMGGIATFFGPGSGTSLNVYSKKIQSLLLDQATPTSELPDLLKMQRALSYLTRAVALNDYLSAFPAKAQMLAGDALAAEVGYVNAQMGLLTKAAKLTHGQLDVPTDFINANLATKVAATMPPIEPLKGEPAQYEDEQGAFAIKSPSGGWLVMSPVAPAPTPLTDADMAKQVLVGKWTVTKVTQPSLSGDNEPGYAKPVPAAAVKPTGLPPEATVVEIHDPNGSVTYGKLPNGDWKSTASTQILTSEVVDEAFKNGLVTVKGTSGKLLLPEAATTVSVWIDASHGWIKFNKGVSGDWLSSDPAVPDLTASEMSTKVGDGWVHIEWPVVVPPTTTPGTDPQSVYAAALNTFKAKYGDYPPLISAAKLTDIINNQEGGSYAAAMTKDEKVAWLESHLGKPGTHPLGKEALETAGKAKVLQAKAAKTGQTAHQTAADYATQAAQSAADAHAAALEALAGHPTAVSAEDQAAVQAKAEADAAALVAQQKSFETAFSNFVNEMPGLHPFLYNSHWGDDFTAAQLNDFILHKAATPGKYAAAYTKAEKIAWIEAYLGKPGTSPEQMLAIQDAGHQKVKDAQAAKSGKVITGKKVPAVAALDSAANAAGTVEFPVGTLVKSTSHDGVSWTKKADGWYGVQHDNKVTGDPGSGLSTTAEFDAIFKGDPAAFNVIKPTDVGEAGEVAVNAVVLKMLQDEAVAKAEANAAGISAAISALPPQWDTGAVNAYIKAMGGNYVGKMNAAQKQQWMQMQVHGDVEGQYALEDSVTGFYKGKPVEHKLKYSHPGSPDSPAYQAAHKQIIGNATQPEWINVGGQPAASQDFAAGVKKIVDQAATSFSVTASTKSDAEVTAIAAQVPGLSAAPKVVQILYAEWKEGSAGSAEIIAANAKNGYWSGQTLAGEPIMPGSVWGGLISTGVPPIQWPVAVAKAFAAAQGSPLSPLAKPDTIAKHVTNLLAAKGIALPKDALPIVLSPDGKNAKAVYEVLVNDKVLVTKWPEAVKDAFLVDHGVPPGAWGTMPYQKNQKISEVIALGTKAVPVTTAQPKSYDAWISAGPPVTWPYKVAQEYFIDKVGSSMTWANGNWSDLTNEIADHLAGVKAAATSTPAAAPTKTVELQLTKKPGVSLGGMHTKFVWTDQFGEDWMSKPMGEKFRVDQEAAALEIARLFGYNAPEARVMTLDGKYSYVQHLDPALGSVRNVDPIDLTEQQLGDVLQEHVLDWAISNHDTHPDNLLRHPDGFVYGIDKGQAFKYFGNDKLAVGYRPPSNPEAVYYDEVYNSITSSKLSKELVDRVVGRLLGKTLQIEQVSDTKYRAILEKAFAKRPSDMYGTTTVSTKEALIDAAIARKNSLTADFTKFYESLYKKAGWTDLPEAQALVKLPKAVAGVIPPSGPMNPATMVAPGLYKGFSQQHLSDVLKVGAAGVPTFVGANDLEEGHILMHVEHAPDQTKQLVGEARLLQSADAKVMAWIKKQPIDNQTGASTPIQQAAPPGTTLWLNDETHHALTQAGITVGHHKVDGQYNQGTIAAMNQKISELQGGMALFKTAAAKSTGKGMVGKIVASEGTAKLETEAQAAAWYKMAQQYVKVAQEITDAMNAKTGTPYSASNPIPKFKWTPPPPKVEPAQKVVSPPPSEIKVLKIGSERPYAEFDIDTGELYLKTSTGAKDATIFHQGSKQQMSVSEASHYGQSGYTYRVTVGDVQIDYRPWSGHSVLLSQQGLLRFRVKNFTGKVDEFENAISTLKDMGLDLSPMTLQQMELMYWRSNYGVMLSKKDANSTFKKVQQYYSQHKVANMDPADEIAMFKEAFRTVIGNKVDHADYVPKLSHINPNAPTIGSGHPWWLRPDIDPFELKTLLGGQFPNHSTATDVVDIVKSGMLAATEERLRWLGRWIGGMSSSSDQGHGSAAYLFSRLRSTNGSIYMNPLTAARTTNYSFPSDTFGKLSSRGSSSPYELKKMLGIANGDNELMTKWGYSVLDDIEVAVIPDSSKRQEVINFFHSRGIYEIRGLKVEERFVDYYGVKTALQKAWAAFEASLKATVAA